MYVKIKGHIEQRETANCEADRRLSVMEEPSRVLSPGSVSPAPLSGSFSLHHCSLPHASVLTSHSALWVSLQLSLSPIAANSLPFTASTMSEPAMEARV